MKIPVEAIKPKWECPRCKDVFRQTLEDVAEVGTAMCAGCGCECDLFSTVDVEDSYLDKYHENLAAMAGDFFVDKRYVEFTEKFGERINGVVGIYELLKEMADVFTQYETEKGIRWDGEWFEAQEAFVDRVFSESLGQEIPSKKRLQEVAQAAIERSLSKWSRTKKGGVE